MPPPRSASRAPRCTDGPSAPNRDRAVPGARAAANGPPTWSRPSNGYAGTTPKWGPCGARPRSPSCSDATGTRQARAPSGVSSRPRWTRARSRRSPACAATGPAPSGAPGPTPDACPRDAKPAPQARSSNSTPSPSPPTPASPPSSSSPPTTPSQSGPAHRLGDAPPLTTPTFAGLTRPHRGHGPGSLSTSSRPTCPFPPRPHPSHPGRWRLRVQGRLRNRMPAPRHHAVRTPSQIARTRRTRRAQQRRLAVRVLRHMGPRQRRPRWHQPMERRLRRRVRHLPTTPGPWRTNPRTVPCSTRGRRTPLHLIWPEPGQRVAWTRGAA